MQRQALLSLLAALAFSPAGAFAQSSDLSGVTMRVLDSLADVDTVVLSLDANRAEGVEGADTARAPAAADEPETEARRERPVREDAAGERRAERRERDELHDTDVDERSEGRLEDRDVAQRTVAAPAAP